MTQHALSSVPAADAPETGVSGRQAVAAGLTGVLSDTVVLMHKTQAYHWNVVGPLFHPLHELTEKQYEELFEAADTLAERVRALGELAPFSVADMMTRAQLGEEDRVRDARGMIEQLIADNEAAVRRQREVAQLAAEHQDGASEDLMNARMSAHEEAVWMLRAVAAE
jgi:starvation-inducible DNA-binding protein